MTLVDDAPAAVVLPGTGSDEVFVRTVFAGPLAAVGVALVTPAPRPGTGLVQAHLAALDAAAEDGPVLVGGVSLGAHLAAEWALTNPDRCAGLLLALPAWNGASMASPAAVAARSGAAAVRRDGLDAALASATAGVAGWLADELDRAWRRHGDELADSLLAAAAHPAPELAALRTLPVPVGVAAFTDDPLHPLAVAQRWADTLPAAVLRTTTLAAMAEDQETLGRAAVLAWLHARFAWPHAR